MLEAVTTDLVSPSAWSAAPKNLQISTTWGRPITPSLTQWTDISCSTRDVRKVPILLQKSFSG